MVRTYTRVRVPGYRREDFKVFVGYQYLSNLVWKDISYRRQGPVRLRIIQTFYDPSVVTYVFHEIQRDYRTRNKVRFDRTLVRPVHERLGAPQHREHHFFPRSFSLIFTPTQLATINEPHMIRMICLSVIPWPSMLAIAASTSPLITAARNVAHCAVLTICTHSVLSYVPWGIG
eukprot:SAG11_NODE_8_length_31217_cov_52.169677_4_plen_174_part_00